MALRKSYIELGWKVDKTGLTTANQETTKMIKKWESALGNIDEYNKRIKQVEAEQRRLTGAVDKTSTSQDKVRKSSREVEQQTKKNTTAQNSQTTAVERTRTKASALGGTMSRIFGKSMFAKQTRDLDKLGDSMQKFGRKMTIASTAIGAGAAYSLKQATELQQQYNTIKNLAVTGGESHAEAGKNTKQIQQDSIKFSNQYGESQKKLANGYETLTRRGYTTAQALGSQKSYLQGAIASGDGYTDVVDHAASAIEQFGMKVNSVKGMAKASKVAVNQMAYSADKTATSFSDLGEAMKYAGPDAHAAHQTLHETVAAVGELSNFGIDGSQAGTSLRQIYQRLTSPPEKGKAPAAMDKLGLKYSDFKDAHHELLPIQEIFAKIDGKMKGWSKTSKGAVYAGLFGVNASSAAQALGSSYDDLVKLDKEVAKSQNMNKGKGYVDGLSKKNMDTFESQWKRVKNGLINDGVDIANGWLPTLKDFAKSTADILEDFHELPAPVKKFTGMAIGIGAALGPLTVALGTLIKMRKVFSTGFSPIVNALKIQSNFGQGKNLLAGINGRNEFGRKSTVQIEGGAKEGRAFSTNAQKGIVTTGSKAGMRFSRQSIQDLNANAARTGKKIGKSASSWNYSGASKTGAKIGTTSYTRMYKNSGKIGTSIGSSSSTRMYRNSSKIGRSIGAKMGGKFMSLGWALWTTDIGSDISGAFKHGIKTKKGQDDAWNTAGEVVGGLIGSTFGPIGAQVGVEMGKKFTETVSFRDILQHPKNAKSTKNNKTNPNKKVDPYNTPGLHEQGGQSWQGTASIAGQFIKGKASGGNGIGKNVKTVQSIGSGKGAPKQSKPKINVQTGFGHASGGPIKKTQTAMVNEAGTEVAYNPRTGRFRLLGNGPAFAKLFAGEHVINAKDTRKLFGGGLGTGKTLKGYASGTGSLTVASVGLGKTSKLTKPSTKGIDGISKAYAKTTKKSNQSIQSFNKTSAKLWSNNTKSAKSATSQMSNTTTKNFTTLKNNATKQLDQTQKNGVTQMKQMHSGMNAVAKSMTSDFYKIMSKLKGYAHSAMAGAISSLNGGISGINTVLNKFGGGGNVLPAIHYATGTGGPITRHTMAVVNDAKSGPRQETIVKPNGRAFMPQGNDTVVPLEPGDEVLNGHDTQSLQAMGALPHFAKGTTGLADLISKNNSHPDQAYAKDFTGNLKGKLASNDLSKDIAKASGKATDGVGKPWYSTVWSVLNDAKSGGSAAGGNWRHDPGMGETNGFGAARSFGSHDGVDFSSSLGSAILAVHGGTVTRVGKPVWGASQLGDVITVKSDDGWQEIYQEFGTMKNIKVAVGDIIKTGQAIATLGPLNGAGSGAHVHIGVAHGSLWDHGGSSTRGWYDVTKMKGTSNGSPKQKSSSKKDNALTKLVKSELGSKVKWVTKNLSDDVGDIGSLGISGSIASRAKILAAAIKKAYPSATNAGIAAVLGNWEFESGLNPGAINPGGGASGLGQWLGGRKTNLINYARKHGQNWKNAGAQLDFALHGDGSDSSVLKRILSGTGSVASLANQFSSQWERGGYNAQHVAGARKIESMLATGGRTPASGFSLVGEKGPELVQFDRPATVRSADKTRQMLAGNSTKVAGNKTIHNTFNIKVNVTGGDDAKSTGKSVAAAVRDELGKLFNGELDNLAY